MNALVDLLGKLFGAIAIWVMVEPWEQALRVRSGRHLKRLSPGLHWRIPLLDVIYKQSVRRRITLVSTQTLTTADGSTVVVAASLGFAIGDIEVLHQSLHDAEDTLCQLALEAVAAHVARTRRADLNPADMADRLTTDLAASFGEFGLTGVSLRITDFAFIRAYRLIQDNRWSRSDAVTTLKAEQS